MEDLTFEKFCLNHLQPICDLSKIELGEEEKKVCFCRKSKCRNGYCECFSGRKSCDGCGCLDCDNRYSKDTTKDVFRVTRN